MEKIEQLKEALCNVRKAHRLLHDYQTRMLNLAHFIKMKLDMPSFKGVKHFSDPISSQSDKNIWRDMWAWDFLYSYVFEYYLGEKTIENSKYAISLIQYSDTGYFDRDNISRNAPFSFMEEKSCISKFLIVIEEIPNNGQWNWGIKNIISKKEYGASEHTITILQDELQHEGSQVLYSIALEKLADEMSTLQELQKFIDECNQHGLKAFQGKQLITL